MSQPTGLPARSEVPKHLTWDLSPLFETDEQWEEALKEVQAKVDRLPEYQGKIQESVASLLEVLETILETSRQASNVYVYSHLKNDQDTGNSTYQAMSDRALMMLTSFGEKTAWFEPELLDLSDETIANYLEEEPALKHYAHYIDRMLVNRPHVLSADKEALLAGAADILSASSQTFSVLNNADLKFPKTTNEDGEQVELSHGLYGQLLESTDRDVRREAFEKLYATYHGLLNTFASTMQGNIKHNNYQARVRNFESARHRALSGNHIPESVHDALVKVVNDRLELLHRYMKVRKDLLGLSELHMYDLYTPVMGGEGPKMTYEEAEGITLDALSILGEEYQEILKKAFSERWIDVVENRGKRSGAYSSGSYDSYPYILLNWHDSLDNLYTLVHELGHSAHSYLTRKNQPYVYGDYSIFLAEIASTTNENLLTDYLLEKADSPLEQAHILSHFLDGFKGTVFRQTQFAEFEHLMHEAAADGQPLTADFLSEKYLAMNEKYYGPHVVSDEQIADEWARIPHFYYNYYVYQYATGFSAATALADRILKDEPGALDKYLNYLRAGNSDYPINVMKTAGLDMTSDDYLQQAMDVFEKRLEQLEETVAKLAETR